MTKTLPAPLSQTDFEAIAAQCPVFRVRPAQSRSGTPSGKNAR